MNRKPAVNTLERHAQPGTMIEVEVSRRFEILHREVLERRKAADAA